MTARLFTAAFLLIAVAGCLKDREPEPATSEKASGPKNVYKDPGTFVASDAEEAKSLVYWYDSRNSKLNVFDQAALEQLMEEGIAKEIRWTPGQVVAQVMPGPGLAPVQAQVAAFSAIDTPPDAIYASVGDMRRLKAYRQRFTLRENRSACLTDLRFAPIFRPAGTTAYVVSSRYHEYLQHTGTIQAPEWVENTVRYTYYPQTDSLACRFYPTTEDRKPKWVTAVKDWP
jgi:hypothetical protein